MPVGWRRISFLEGAKRASQEGSCWQGFKWVCKWNGQQMALVRAPVVWDMLSMAVHFPDLATVRLPSHNRAPGAAGRESVLIQCVQLPPGEGGGEEPPKQIQPNGPFDTDKSSTGHESGAAKGSLPTHSDCHVSRDKEKSSSFWCLLSIHSSKPCVMSQREWTYAVASAFQKTKHPFFNHRDKTFHLDRRL